MPEEGITNTNYISPICLALSVPKRFCVFINSDNLKRSFFIKECFILLVCWFYFNTIIIETKFQTNCNTAPQSSISDIQLFEKNITGFI